MVFWGTRHRKEPANQAKEQRESPKPPLAEDGEELTPLEIRVEAFARLMRLRFRQLFRIGPNRARNYVGRIIGLAKPPSPDEPLDYCPLPRNRYEAAWWRFLWWFYGKTERSKRQKQLERIFFGVNSTTARLFDIVLLLAIVVSVLLFMLESMPSLYRRMPVVFIVLEWVITLIFTVEYGLRLYSVRVPAQYMRSFFGLVDLVSTLPLYINALVPGAHYLLVLRMLRLLRLFRILKLFRFVSERDTLIKAIKASMYKIFYFLFVIVILVCIIGTLMYMVEGRHPESGFTSIPRAIYWSIVTLTTVGYGDISPVTGFGQFLASVIMLLGYAIIAVPTGIVTAEMLPKEGQSGRTKAAFRPERKSETGRSRVCNQCGYVTHDARAAFCSHCGHELERVERES